MRLHQRLLRTAACVAIATLCHACVVNAGSWSLTNFSVSVAAGVAFTSGSHGYLASGANGVGAEILVTDDGGTSFKPTRHEPALMFLAVDAKAESAVAAGLFSDQFSSDNGRHFNTSLGGGGPCQSVVAFGSNSYGVTGTFGSKNGVAISTDGGQTFTSYNIPFAKGNIARYGAFPSDTTWYITAGSWPESNDDDGGEFSSDSGAFALSQRITLVQDAQAQEWKPVLRRYRAGARVGNETGEFTAAIAKTTDGGKTFKIVYSKTNAFYFNQISCADVNTCLAVAEADQGPEAGARIFRTTDGGGTWDQVHFDTGAPSSLMAVKMLSTTEAWAGGGFMSFVGFAARLWHTTDGGSTWTLDKVADAYANDLSFVNGGALGWASAFLIDEQSGLLRYR